MQRRWFLRLGFLALGTGFALSIAYLTWTGIVFYAGKSKWKAKIEELRKQGHPVSLEDVQFLYTSRTTPAYSSEWSQLLKELHSPSYLEQCRSLPFVDPSNPLPPVGQASMSPPNARGQALINEAPVLEFLDEQRNVIGRLKSLAPVSHAVYAPIRFDRSEVADRDLLSIEPAIRLLCLDSELALHLQDAGRLLQDIRALLGCVEVRIAEPFLSSHQSSMVVESIALDHVRQGVEKGLFNRPHLDVLFDLIRGRSSFRMEWSSVIQGERGLFIAHHEDRLRSTAAFYLTDFVGPIATLQTLGTLEKAWERDLEHFAMELEKSMFDLPEAAKSFDELSRDRKGERLIRSLIGLGHQQANLQTSRRMCVLAIAIRLYEKSEGAIPDSLTELESIGLKLNGLNQHDGTAFQYRLLESSHSKAELNSSVNNTTFYFR